MVRQKLSRLAAGSKNVLMPLLGAALMATLSPAPSSAAIGDFRVTIDYSKADTAYFTDDVKKQVEAGARFWEKFIADARTVNVVVVADSEIRALATAAASEFETNTDEKFVPTQGGIAFSTSLSLEPARAGRANLMALTIHELGHVFGFSEGVKAYASRTQDGKFVGESAMRMNNGEGVPLNGSHFPGGFKDADGVTPRMSNGGGNLLSVLDLAVLKDLGWDIPQVPSEGGRKQPYLVQRSADGSQSMEAGTLKYRLEGLAGDDTLIADQDNSELQGDYGSSSPVEDPPNGGQDTFVIQAKKVSIKDLDPGKDIILLSPDLITEGEVETLLNDSTRFIKDPPGPDGSFTPGSWLIKLGDTEVTIRTKPTKEDPYGFNAAPPTAANFKIGNYTGP